MHAVQLHAPLRGVVCEFCGKPIPLSASFIKRKVSIKAESTLRELAARLFRVRCRDCGFEGIYSFSQFVDFQD
jgi:hypothetical protein